MYVVTRKWSPKVDIIEGEADQRCRYGFGKDSSFSSDPNIYYFSITRFSRITRNSMQSFIEEENGGDGRTCD